MATVKFEKANCSFGYKTKGRSRRAWLKGFIDEIAGVEGANNDSYHGNLKYVHVYMYTYDHALCTFTCVMNVCVLHIMM